LPPAADKAKGAIALAATNDLREMRGSDVISGDSIITQFAQWIRRGELRPVRSLNNLPHAIL